MGNIFDIRKSMEDKVAELEANSIIDNSDTNRAALNKANSELIRVIKKEKAFWRQKIWD